MSKIVVVGPDQMPDWLHKRARIFHELDQQLIRGLENPGSGLTLEQLQVVVEHRNSFEIVPPLNGRIHILSVSVDESRVWDDAVRTAGPDTTSNGDIWKVGDQYPPKAESGQNIQEIILVNFGKYMSSEDALKWGKSQRLHPVTPRACFAVGEHSSNLNHALGMSYMAVVALDPNPSSFGAGQCVCYVWWNGAERMTRFSRFVIGWDANFWFAFVRE